VLKHPSYYSESRLEQTHEPADSRAAASWKHRLVYLPTSTLREGPSPRGAPSVPPFFPSFS
jgi:hypothetical protein